MCKFPFIFDQEKFISDEKVEKIVNCVDISDNEKKLLNIVQLLIRIC